MKKWSSHHGQQKSSKCSTWMQSQNERMISVHFQGKPFNITVIQVYAPTSNAEEAEVESFYEDLQDLLEQHTIRSDQISRSVVSDSLRPLGLQHVRLRFPLPAP